MLLILEIAMLVGGIYAIFTSKVPSFLLGGRKYPVEGKAARRIGVVFILPLPISLLGVIVLLLLFGQKGIRYAILLDFVSVLGLTIMAIVLKHRADKRAVSVNDMEAKISKKAEGALMCAIFSATGIATLICCPLAIVYANQSLKLIDENNVGEQYHGKSKTARTLAIIFTVLWVVTIICFMSAISQVSK